MNELILEPNLTDADAFYAALTEAHRDATPEQSENINSRLILILANHIGDNQVLTQAIEIARENRERAND